MASASPAVNHLGEWAAASLRPSAGREGRCTPVIPPPEVIAWPDGPGPPTRRPGSVQPPIVSRPWSTATAFFTESPGDRYHADHLRRC